MNNELKPAAPATSAVEQPAMTGALNDQTGELDGDELAGVTGGTGKRILPEMVNAG